MLDRATAKIDVRGERPLKVEQPWAKVTVAVEGSRTALVVRITSPYLNEVGSYVDEIRDLVFGSAVGSSDRFNLHDGYADCSHGKLDFQPAYKDATEVPVDPGPDGTFVGNVMKGWSTSRP